MRNYRNIQNSGNMNIVAMGEGGSTNTGDYIMLDTMYDVEISAMSLIGKKVMTRGYYSVDDGGGAPYLVTNQELPWSIYLGNGRYANIIKSDYVNYRMFGAKLDGSTDKDTEDIRKCHRYADSIYTLDENNCKVFTCWVKNHSGIIHVLDPIYCSGNVDLSGSTILVNDDNAQWFGSYVWGENSGESYAYNVNPEMKESMVEGAFRLEGMEDFPENTVLHLTETHYEIRDDDGYLYDVDKGELMVHRQGGIFATALGSDWTNAGGTLIYNELEDDFMTTEFKIEYTYLPTVHRTFIGCEVVFEGDANNYCTVIWIMGHNCTVRDFTFHPKPEVLSNTRFKNSMIYVWGSYNVTIKNCNGMNASGKITPNVPTPTSGYAIRGFQVCDLVIEDCSIVGIWGSITVSSSKNVFLNRVTCNRIDVHDYIVNLFVNNCIVYSHALQIGSGSGACLISNTLFYHQHIPEERYPGAHVIALQTGYGRTFNGKISLQNCKYIFLTKDNLNEFGFVWMRFRPDARSIERKMKFPEITIRDFTFETLVPDSVLLSFINVRGEIKTTTSDSMPPVTHHVAFSGDTKWDSVKMTRNWSDLGYYNEGEIIRKMERYTNSKGKTVFHSIEYYIVLKTERMTINDEGVIRAIRKIPIRDPETGEIIGEQEIIVEDEEVARRIYAPYYMPGAGYDTTEGQEYVVARSSRFFPEEVFSGNTGWKTGGPYPTHTSGVEWVGDDLNEGLFLRFEESNVTIPDWRPFMYVTSGTYITVDVMVFEVVQSGSTTGELLEDVEWLSTRDWGTARVKYIGSLWMPGAWLPESGLALVYTNPGYNGEDFTYNIYRAVQRDGRVLGDNLLSASGTMLDGGIIWQRTDETPSEYWSPRTHYPEGTIVDINGVAHEAVFVQRLAMPQRITINNIVHSSTINPFIFYFENGTYVPTEGRVKVVIDSMDEISGISYQNNPFFGDTSNEEPSYAVIEESYDDSEIIYDTYSFSRGDKRFSVQNVRRDLPTVNVGRLEITNNNPFAVYYHLYESYDYGNFNWTLLKTIRVPAGTKNSQEYIKLSGTRNDFVAQTQDEFGIIEAPDTTIQLIFSNRTNSRTPTIICP